jgi:membrane protease YdiL (CAAX protease family)
MWLAAHWYMQYRTGAPLAFSLAFTWLGVLPAVAAAPILARSPGELGLGLGDRRAGMALLSVGLPVALLAVYVGTRSPAIAAYYPLDPAVTRDLASFLPHAILYVAYYLGFEYFFRGFLLFGLVERLGPLGANAYQAGLATLVHAARPEMEFWAALPASLAFGWVALRTRSIWYGVVIHGVVGVGVDWVLVG